MEVSISHRTNKIEEGSQDVSKLFSDPLAPLSVSFSLKVKRDRNGLTRFYFLCAIITVMPLCRSCEFETKYHCLSCRASVCNRAECSVVGSEETPNWKAGSSVAFCLTCNPVDENAVKEIDQTKVSLTRREGTKPSTS